MKLFNRIFWFGVISIGIFLGRQTGVYAAEIKPLLFVSDMSYPPVTYLNQQEPDGLVVDIVKILSKKIGRDTDIKLMDWQKAQMMVATGAADFLAPMGITETRKQIYDFSDPLIDLTYSIFVRGRIGISGLEDLHGLRVGVTSGGLPRTLVEADEKLIPVLINDYLQGFRMMEEEKLDVVIGDTWVGTYLLALNKITSIQVISPPIATLKSAIAVKKGNTGLLSIINTGLKEMREDGTLDGVITKWNPRMVVFETREQVAQRNANILLGVASILIFFMVLVIVFLRFEIRRNKREKERTLESERKIRAIFDLSFELIGLLSPQGKLLDVNQTALDMIGATSSDVVGKMFGDTPWWSHSPKSQEKINKAIKLASEGKLVRDTAIHIDTLGQKRIVDFTLKPVTDEYNRVIFLIPEGRDVTESVKNQEELNKLNDFVLSEKQKLEVILRDMGDAVLVTDISKIIVLVNKAMEKIIGASKENIVGKKVDKMINLSYITSKKWPDDILISIFEEKMPGLPKESIVMNQPGMPKKIVEVMASPLLDDQKKLTGSVWVFRDITREKEIDRMKTDFVSLASHQLRTPLTGIKWFSEILKKELNRLSIKEISGYIEKIELSNERMIDLVTDLLVTEKVDNKKLNFETSKVNLKSVIEDLIDKQRSVILERNIQISGLDSIPSDLTLETDLSQISQVLDNVLNNAVIYSHNNGTVEIKVKHADDNVTVSVEDHGFGIPENQKGEVFKKFFRADNVSRTIAGSGLGMYVAKNIIENLGGKIWFESEVNKGSTFFFQLPIKRQV